MRLSYSCTPNMKSIISSHNKKILEKKPQDENNCCCTPANKNNCPLEGNCKTSELVYQASVSSDNGVVRNYTGAAATTFKLRYNNHKKSFTHRKYRHETVLSDYIWDLKDQGINFSIKWKIIRRSQAYSPVTQKCRLCLDEKVQIMRNSGNPSFLNKRNEMFSKCRHRNEHLMSSVKK